MTPDQKTEIDHMLCLIDDICISEGLPPLSGVVTHDDGAASVAFWMTVEKHKLQREGETKPECLSRIRREAHEAAKAGKYPILTETRGST